MKNIFKQYIYIKYNFHPKEGFFLYEQQYQWNTKIITIIHTLTLTLMIFKLHKVDFLFFTGLVSVLLGAGKKVYVIAEVVVICVLQLSILPPILYIKFTTN